MNSTSSIRQSFPGRIKAFLIHLVISLIILFVLLYLLVFVWYPPPLFKADGGLQGLKIILGVDLILGPLLTLMVYNPGKGWKRLKFDLWVIGIIQVSALIAGTWIVYDQRTQLVVFSQDHFFSITKSQLNRSNIDPDLLKQLRKERPPLAFVGSPTDFPDLSSEEKSGIMNRAPYVRGEFFQPVDQSNVQEIMAKGFDLGIVSEELPHRAHMISDFLAELGKTTDDVSAVPLICRYEEVALIMDRASGELLDTLTISHGELLSAALRQRRLQQSQQ